MAQTRIPRSTCSGYSLIEVLIVLAIVAILGIAGASALGNRGGNSVRVVLDELEGAIMDAHKYAADSGRDMAIVTWNKWDLSAATADRLLLARGAASQTSEDIQKVALNLIAQPPVLPQTDPAKTVAVLFAPSNSREYMNVGVVIKDSAWWTNAMQAAGSGKKNDDITTVDPFKSDPFKTIFADSANNLFQGTVNQVSVSGSNKRFNQSFWIQVVSTAAGGSAVPGGAMGLIVVQNNGATVYKFYNSGVSNGDGKWRRI